MADPRVHGFCNTESSWTWEEELSERDTVTLNPDDPFEAALFDIVNTNRKKRADYAGTGDPFQNFKDSAYQINSTPGLSCEQLIATKQSRLRTILKPGHAVSNESIEDTILDRAVYSIIALCLYRAGCYES